MNKWLKFLELGGEDMMSKIILEFMKDINYQIYEDKRKKIIFTNPNKLRS